MQTFNQCLSHLPLHGNCVHNVLIALHLDGSRKPYRWSVPVAGSLSKPRPRPIQLLVPRHLYTCRLATQDQRPPRPYFIILWSLPRVGTLYWLSPPQLGQILTNHHSCHDLLDSNVPSDMSLPLFIIQREKTGVNTSFQFKLAPAHYHVLCR